jgi:hypothetical protein
MITIRNQWASAGSNQEAQRQDLWLINLSGVVDIVKNPTGVAPSDSYLYIAQSADNFDVADERVQAITLPEEMIDVYEFISRAQKRNFPAYDAPVSLMRMDFYHDVGSPEASSVHSLLRCWQLLAQAGQESADEGVMLPLADSTSVPGYKADLWLTMLRGSDSPLTGTMDYSGTYLIRDCWCSDLQVNSVSMDGKEVVKITATVQVAAVLPQT